MIGWLKPGRPAPRTAPAAPAMIPVGGRMLPLKVSRLRQARRMTMRLAPDGSAIRVSLPPWVPEHEAIAFAMARRDWLERQLDAAPGGEAPAPGGSLAYRGRALTIAWASTSARKPVVDGNVVIIGGPVDSLPRRLGRWLESEAMRLFADDLAHYCGRAGHAMPGLALSRAQRRWGSCAADGTIRLNWRLVMAPDMVRRSVVAHEVAHLSHFDHSPAFHACLAGLFEDDIAEANRWLKRHGRELYRPFG